MRAHPPPDHEDLKDRIHAQLLARCHEDPATGCWLYRGPDGGQDQYLEVLGRRYSVARLALWTYTGFSLDSPKAVVPVCRTPRCVAWEHLAAVDRAEAAGHRQAV